MQLYSNDNIFKSNHPFWTKQVAIWWLFNDDLRAREKKILPLTLSQPGGQIIMSTILLLALPDFLTFLWLCYTLFYVYAFSTEILVRFLKEFFFDLQNSDWRNWKTKNWPTHPSTMYNSINAALNFIRK